ncbi:MAG: hypothetical protein ACM3Q2_15800 [Syntrophothermus sp.]
MTADINSLHCMVCGCPIHRNGNYARPTIKGRSHATRHHFVPERFFGRSSNRPKTERISIIKPSELSAYEGEYGWFCYECHEELLHNPVILPEDIKAFADLVRLKKYNEDEKSEERNKLLGRIELLKEIIQKGIKQLLTESLQEDNNQF